MASPKSGESYSASSSKRDMIPRGVKKPNNIGTATFVGARALDPFLQYSILGQGLGNGLISRLGGEVLPQGPALITNSFLDSAIGLSPYRTILFAMSAGSMLKQNITVLAYTQEEVTPQTGLIVGAFNAAMNSVNSLLFVCRQTSASTNGEHFPQSPLIVGSILYATGIAVELGSEVQRAVWKKDPANKGKVYEGGLFALSRHVNYLGYTMWRGGYALAAGGWVWGAITAGFFAYDFTQRGIPVLQHYLEEKYGAQYDHYKQAVPYKLLPYVY
ncbi:hypothetical protein B0A48_00835 [Cryoendolithus antarcticus]|uniref:Uncharacterized protein n=1 Tax=Cryoendolithus antarcticus TaxID=1507870 RepID=A0A1V8TRG3_9PEZI|nr:hypothetical protein B0A48_00835 [Cryoendolithus antarcticus]